MPEKQDIILMFIPRSHVSLLESQDITKWVQLHMVVLSPGLTHFTFG